MKKFVINKNAYLSKDTQAFYNTEFYGYNKLNNPNYLNVLKNDNHQSWNETRLQQATRQLESVLLADLPNILSTVNIPLTVCVAPRAKKEDSYRPDQLLFRGTVKKVLNQLGGNFIDGINYIIRHTDTKTTHLRRPMENFPNDGKDPYPGITKDTCTISNDVKGKDILLIDDIYTKTVNIDEDAIQALIDKGANSVCFYAIGYTIMKSI